MSSSTYTYFHKIKMKIKKKSQILYSSFPKESQNQKFADEMLDLCFKNYTNLYIESYPKIWDIFFILWCSGLWNDLSFFKISLFNCTVCELKKYMRVLENKVTSKTRINSPHPQSKCRHPRDKEHGNNSQVQASSIFPS